MSEGRWSKSCGDNDRRNGGPRMFVLRDKVASCCGRFAGLEWVQTRPAIQVCPTTQCRADDLGTLLSIAVNP